MATKTKPKPGASTKHSGKKGRGLSARKPIDYDNETHGRRDSNAPPDDRTLNPKLGQPVNLIRPKYNEGSLIYRPYPMLDYTDPEHMLQPGRKNMNTYGQTHWALRMATANYIGLPDCPHFTFNLYLPSDKTAKANNPYRIFYFACKNAYDNGQFGKGREWKSEWNRLMKGSKKGGAAITPPNFKWYNQGEVYAVGDKVFVGDEAEREVPLGRLKDDDLTVIQIPGGGGNGYMDLLDLKKKEWEGDEEKDPAVAFKFGSAVGRFNKKEQIITGGLFIEIFNPKKKKITKNTSWDGKIADIQGYEAALHRKLDLNGTEYLPDLDKEAVKNIFKKVCFWLDDAESGTPGLLYVPSPEEQALWIAQAYASIPKLVSYAFSERDEFMTAEVKAVLSKRVQGVVPGGDEDDDEEEEEAPKKGKKKGGKQDPTQKSFQEDEDEEEDDDSESDDDDEEDDDSEDDDEEEDDDSESDDTDDEEDDDSESDDDEEEDDDSEDEDDDSESDDDEEEDDDDSESDDDSEEEEDDDSESDDDEEEDDDSEDEDDDSESDDDEEEDDDSESDDEDDDSESEDDDEEDDDSESDDEDDEEEEEKPKGKGGKKDAKPAAKGKKGNKPGFPKDGNGKSIAEEMKDSKKKDAKGKKGKGAKAEDDDPFDGAADDSKTKKSMKAANAAKGKGAKRNEAPKAPAPKPGKKAAKPDAKKTGKKKK